MEINRHTLRELLTELSHDEAIPVEALMEMPLVLATRSGEIPLLSVYENEGTLTFDVGEERVREVSNNSDSV